MQNSQSNQDKPDRRKLNFFLVAAGFMLLLGLAIVLHLPELQSWQWSRIDSLIGKARETNDEQARYSYLRQAAALGQHDPAATQALAQFWLERGELNTAIDVYQGGIANPNQVALGRLALKAQNYQRALGFFEAASRQKKTAQSLDGEAVAKFNLGDNSAGCEKALSAAKLELGSSGTKQILQACIILTDNSNDEITSLAGATTEGERAKAYLLLDAQAYKPGEDILNRVERKTPADYLVLARLAAARGELGKATELAEQGIAQDETNYDLNVALVKYYELQDKDDKAKIYQQRLESLQAIRAAK